MSIQIKTLHLLLIHLQLVYIISVATHILSSVFYWTLWLGCV